VSVNLRDLIRKTAPVSDQQRNRCYFRSRRNLHR